MLQFETELVPLNLDAPNSDTNGEKVIQVLGRLKTFIQPPR